MLNRTAEWWPTRCCDDCTKRSSNFHILLTVSWRAIQRNRTWDSYQAQLMLLRACSDSADHCQLASNVIEVRSLMFNIVRFSDDRFRCCYPPEMRAGNFRASYIPWSSSLVILVPRPIIHRRDTILSVVLAWTSPWQRTKRSPRVPSSLETLTSASLLLTVLCHKQERSQSLTT